MFGKGNDFAKKITYKTDGADPEQLIRPFRNDYNPRIAVTVDMIATGTDVKPLEVLIFLRDVKSALYFEQMKGRGARTISADATAPGDARRRGKDPLRAGRRGRRHRKPEARLAAAGARTRRSPSTGCIDDIAAGRRDDDALSTLAARLAALDRKIDDKDRATHRQGRRRPRPESAGAQAARRDRSRRD